MSPLALMWIPAGLALAIGVQQTGDPEAGGAYAQTVCAQCHTINGAEPSPEPTAPPFEVVANTPGMMGTALAVWLTTSHPTMPNIVLEPQDLDNVIAFILTLKD